MSKQILPLVMLALMLVGGFFPSLCIQHAGTESATIMVPDDYSTIQEAINAANEGDTVFVKNGVYYEHVIVNKSISLIGENKYSTIIDGSFNGSAVCVASDSVNVTGFSLLNGGYPNGSYAALGILVISDNNRISHNVIGNSFWGIYLASSNGNVVQENEFTSSYLGVSLGGSSGNAISKNSVGSNRVGISAGSGGNYELWTMNTDGSNQTRLTWDKSSEDTPSWSPNGSRIAYTRTSSFYDHEVDIWVMNPDGTDIRQVTKGLQTSFCNWSPDCSKIVFSSQAHIWKMNSDGTNAEQLTTGSTYDLAPAWSPDGEKIAFWSFRENTQGIWIMNPDGTDQTQVTTWDLQGAQPSTTTSWSPDGSKIAFDFTLYDYQTKRSAIWIVNRDGTNLTKLTSSEFQEAYPQWSPDGTKIAYSAHDDHGTWDIWIMNADGTNRTRLTTDMAPSIYSSWSPDGSQLVFQRYTRTFSADNTIIENTILNNQESGMTLGWGTMRNAVQDNLILGNGHGLKLVQSNENTIINNTITNNTRGSYYTLVDCGIGLYLDRSESNILRNNKLADNAVNFLVENDYPVEQGIRGYYVNDVDESNLVNEKPICYWVNQSDRQVPTNAGCVLLVNSTNILVEDLPNLEHNGFGVELYRTTNSTIRNVTASNNLFFGIDLLLSSDNNLMNNTATSNNLSGITIRMSSGNKLVDNKVTDSVNQMGMLLMGSGNNTLRSNVMVRNNMNLMIGGAGPTILYSHYDNDVDESNTVDGKPVYYWMNQHNRTVPSDGGTVFLVNCSGIAVKDLDIEREGFGVGLLNTVDSRVENVTVQRCWGGIVLADSQDNIVSNCTIADGIPLMSFGPSQFAIFLLNASYNTIEGNTLANMTGSGGSPFAGGIILAGSFNRIVHNNFLNSPVFIGTPEQLYGNAWDDGYPSGGNYWSDYAASDVYCGPEQNEAGSDGITDTPYTIDGNNTDRYPLACPYPCIHDAAAEDVKPNKNVIGSGFTAKIELSIANHGHFAETVNVTVYANATAIGSFANISLASGSTTTLAFLWNTTSFDLGNYAIESAVEPVPSEVYMANNNCTYETVYVGVDGDVDGNHWVNMLDLYYIALNFGKTEPYTSTQTANCDVDDNGIVNMLDLYIAAMHFGQTDP